MKGLNIMGLIISDGGEGLLNVDLILIVGQGLLCLQQMWDEVLNFFSIIYIIPHCFPSLLGDGSI